MELHPKHRQTTPSASSEQVEQWIADIQPDVRAYIISINGTGEDIEDIIQETNIFLWQRHSEFKPGTSFKAWAFRVAYFKTMAHRRDRIRRGEVVFDEAIFQRIASRAEETFSQQNDTLTALRHCVSLLKQEEQSIISEKYIKQRSLKEFAKEIGKSADSIHKSISRVRVKLAHCIKEQLNK
ncbi:MULTISPECIES: sigma-70 family RNA polymerase sigma factor [Rubritalea]|nr:sigma-70 family RNA polymerase sigma factor [Rubritalea squalenifaciens]